MPQRVIRSLRTSQLFYVSVTISLSRRVESVLPLLIVIVSLHLGACVHELFLKFDVSGVSCAVNEELLEPSIVWLPDEF